MTSLVKKIKKGRPYYYAVESARVNGRPRIVWQKYLGTLDAIIKRAQDAQPPAVKEAVLFEAGGVAALLRITQDLGLLELINQFASQRQQGPSSGHCLLLAAFKQALVPGSQLALGQWYEQTILRRLWRFPKSAFSRQRLPELMGWLNQERLEALQSALLPRIQRLARVDSQVLLYDIPKVQRDDLRQVGVVVLVTREFQIPLLHRLYAGRSPAGKLFPRLSEELIGWYRQIAGGGEEATLVFATDKLPEDIIEPLVDSGLHFVAALSAKCLPELLKVPPERFEPIASLKGTRAFSTAQLLGAKTCRVVVYLENPYQLHYAIDHPAFKTILITDHLHWSAQQIIEASRYLARIEESFRNQPLLHGTDQELRVQAFCCLLALTLTSLAHKTVQQGGLDISLEVLVKELKDIREVVLIYPSKTESQSRITLSRMSARQRRLTEVLRLQPILGPG